MEVMQMTRSLKTLGSIVLVLCAFTVNATAADPPKHVNKHPTFTPTPPDRIEAEGRKKLGKAPKLSKEEMKELVKGEVIVREVVADSTDEAKRFEAIGTIDAPPAKVAAFLKNYKDYPKYMPHMEKIDFKWNGNMATVEQTLKIAFSTIWYKLNLRHYEPYYIEWEYVYGDIKTTRGFYKFFPYKKGTKTLVQYSVFTDPGLPVPQFVLDMLTKNSLPDVLRAVRKGVRETG